MPIFPKKTESRRLLRQYCSASERARIRCERLKRIWRQIAERHSRKVLLQIQPEVLSNLGRWQAYRYRYGPRNETFLKDLGNSPSRYALFRLVTVTHTSGSLHAVLKEKSALETVYEFLKKKMILEEKPARIVAISKALLMIGGFSPGFDSAVSQVIKSHNPYLLICPGVWPFCVYYEALQFLADEQNSWEKKNGPMLDLLSQSEKGNVPIGQIMDRILWGMGKRAS